MCRDISIDPLGIRFQYGAEFIIHHFQFLCGGTVPAHRSDELVIS